MSKGKNQNRRRRDISTISNDSLPTPTSRPYDRPSIRPRNLLRELEDRRTWHPEGPRRPARGFKSSRHRLALTQQTTRRSPSAKGRGMAALPSFQPKLYGSPLTKIGFVEPQQVAICVRRKQREEVLHALKKTGKSGQKRPKRSYYSSISCKGKK